ncbi:MAG: NADH-quinone oxidoreductase subunit NuoF [Thermoanaerobaculaceae bacterium]|nr:NADH-quinone oxidoreductase subunit NuoF [Thermoanaerobaculaceae bacterium]MDI9620578.1 NADH-quinone oxidoreductase subunit NuoF [Acidobacteriota bacterium]NLH11729.1 NADH-quinone oxidoreductase subunit NuoF [Holophagae bacterium]HPW55458.1 NADH-quinone oxidoreductase subunit NuoF [Thermoanaerobaculaceae bacterium]
MREELSTAIESIAARYPERRSALLPALHLVQQHSGGFVGAEDLAAIAEVIGVPVSEAYGVQTYYTMFQRKKLGKYHLQVDTNIPAMLAGAEAIVNHLERALGITVGETTADGLFTLSTVECLASCGTCPVIQVNDRYYESMTPERTDALLASLRQGVMPDMPVVAHFHSECGVLMARRGMPNATDIDVYVASGGYRAIDRALEMEPAKVVGEVKASNLRGRGGAGFPAGVKWGFLARGTGKPTYLICNADEGEPGTFKDRQIMQFDPHLLIEGMIISGYAVGAALGFIYIRGEFAWIAEILERAIAQARSRGLLGTNIKGTGFDFDIIVHLGAGAYVCGEETALIESLEGKRGNPRLKPPFPAVVGVYGCPTVVNNVETLASVPFIIEHGAGQFMQFGTANNFGPKIFGISGHVKRPGAYEFPLGTPLARLLEAAGGVDGELKAIIVGGLSVPILTAEEAKGLLMDYDSCLKYGTMLGSGGIMVMNETTSIPKVALRAIRFYAHESCGQCTPCRQGSHTVAMLLERIVAGRGSRVDIDRVLQLCAAIKGTTLCPTGDAFAVPIEAMVTKFRAEFEALVD